MPFRLRIALLSALISAAVLLAFGYGTWLWITQERWEAVDREILTLAYRHPGWIGNRVTYDKLSSAVEFVFGADRKENLILLVKDTAGKTLFLSPHWPAEIPADQLDLNLADDPKAQTRPAATQPTPRGKGRGGPGFGRYAEEVAPVIFTKIPRFQTASAADSTWRLGLLGNSEARMVIGLNCDELQRELRRLRNAFLACLPLALLLVGGGGWLVACRAVRPLRSISETAERVTARGLDQRIPATASDPEIARLIGVLNRMMDRLEASFRQATRFSADASHELKTPLAVMQGELEHALQSAAPGSREQQVFANLLEEALRLKTITQSLLLLSRADAGQLNLALEPLNLAARLPELIEDAEVLGAQQKLEFKFDLVPELQVRADWPLLQQAIRNLLHNAIQYNEPGGRVYVSLASANGVARLEVSNTGLGIPSEDQPRIFDRFYRVDASRARQAEGLGLGLSLAREIVRAHRGDLVLQESRPGHTVFLLSLPLAQQ
jgi:heavy metal sensor kinase